MTITAREAAYLALLHAIREEGFIADWLANCGPTDPRNLNLAREIASGACRMQRALADRLDRTHGAPLSLKRKERALLYTAVYQTLYMDRIPHHAIVHETVAIAKRLIHRSFARFTNALLRKLCNAPPPPSDDLATRLSYPDLFVEMVHNETILETMNHPPIVMARLRRGAPPPGWRLDRDEMIILGEGGITPEVAASSDLYIQNRTPVDLMRRALEGVSPTRILDLCAAPGGKALLLADLFPSATIDLNDLSSRRAVRLEELLQKYHLNAQIQIGPGESYETNMPYDLIVIDAPCSNSGVLHKRPEARWRITREQLANLKQTQESLLNHALSLVSQNGLILYLTCSILSCENEEIIASVDKLCSRLYCETIYPALDGADGGFGCLLQVKW